MTQKKALIIIPTFNEKENVDRMIDALLELDDSFHVLFVDDNSPDGTANIISERMNTSSGRVHLEKRKGRGRWLGGGAHPSKISTVEFIHTSIYI